MVRLFPWLWLLVFVCACGSQGPSPADIAGHAAKVYYDRLLQGHYDQFVDGRYLPDSIPASYRDQLITNMQMFMGQQQQEHGGLREVRYVSATADTARHVAQVYLLFVYGDKTTEQVLVPMVEHKGVWYMR